MKVCSIPSPTCWDWEFSGSLWLAKAVVGPWHWEAAIGPDRRACSKGSCTMYVSAWENVQMDVKRAHMCDKLNMTCVFVHEHMAQTFLHGLFIPFPSIILGSLGSRWGPSLDSSCEVMWSTHQSCCLLASSAANWVRLRVMWCRQWLVQVAMVTVCSR